MPALCINNSGTYRNITIGCINQSGTYRNFLFNLPLGSSYEGGFLICKQSPNVRWVVSPYSAEVSRTWYNRNDASSRAQQVSGCSGWFVPTPNQLQNPGFACRSFWGPSPCFSGEYWSDSDFNDYSARTIYMTNGCIRTANNKQYGKPVRAFRCVTY